MLKMLKYPNGENKGEINTDVTVEQIKDTQGLFFRNKATGARETYKAYKGFLIVTTKIKGEPISRRATWAYFPKGFDDNPKKTPALSHVGMEGNLPDSWAEIDKILESGICG